MKEEKLEPEPPQSTLKIITEFEQDHLKVGLV